ncbi:FAD-dependent oxidoreductase [Actinocatenispora thailandica]|uniref:FAD-dependent oxidoreductase n=1 Tax=Actinocatenispora thailandica TaxID=227318 RepID=A0A7R7DP38_9ACTN|nr:NAD(P)/FAD-dependent oxidoreductase [Actinocatenispora thailandica]BCJ35320.1 FAD-dependent oxidoreductase [Actinocatenispora thailandica]
MLRSIDPATQYQETRRDPLRVLVVGAGVAGVTTARLLRHHGLHPVLIERSATGGAEGYMLALMPMVTPVFEELDLWPEYRKNGIPFGRYRLCAHTGRAVRTDSMGELLADYGDYRGISRGGLLDVLSGADCPVSPGTTVAALTEAGDAVTVRFDPGEDAVEYEFDLVVVADGIGSATRELVGAGPVGGLNTGWGGWVAWAPADDEQDLGEELWGAGFFLGSYPVLDRIGVFLGGPDAVTADGPERFVAEVQRRLHAPTARTRRALRAVLDADDPYYWPMRDVRASRWVTRHTVLLGDAAAGFLPTAGIGAGMAMESAWVLSRLLRHADRANLATLLEAYEGVQRPRVEAAQDNSRSLAKMMFRSGTAFAVGRDVAARLLSIRTVLKPIRQLLDGRPDPDAAARRALSRTA